MIEFALGFVAALVAIQFFPRLSYVGVWIVTRVKNTFKYNGGG